MSRALVATYRAAIRLYPRPFRTDYGPDLVLLLEHQLRDEPMPRVAGRLVLDLAISVPTRHLETHVKHMTPSMVTLAFATLSLAALSAGLVIGSERAWLVAAIGVAAASATVAVSSYRRSRLLSDDRSVTAHWWKPLLLGPSVIAAFAALTSWSGELSEIGWLLGMIVLLAALLTTAAGIALGIARLAGRRRPAAP